MVVTMEELTGVTHTPGTITATQLVHILSQNISSSSSATAATTSVIHPTSTTSPSSALPGTTVLLLDCRTPAAYTSGHIVTAVNALCPPLARKRHRDGALPLRLVLPNDTIRRKLAGGLYDAVVLYDETGSGDFINNLGLGDKSSISSPSASSSSDALLLMALKSVTRDAAHSIRRIVLLQGGYSQFSRTCRALCSSSNNSSSNSSGPTNQQPHQQQQLITPLSPAASSHAHISSSLLPPAPPSTLLLSLQDTSAVPSSHPSSSSATGGISCCCHVGGCSSAAIPPRSLSPSPFTASSDRLFQGEPAELLPWLYLGSQHHAHSEHQLRRLGITAVLNVSAAGESTTTGGVTSSCGGPSTTGTGSSTDGTTGNGSGLLRTVAYKRIPVDDGWMSDLHTSFPEAIAFIGDERAKGGKVLVHCQAGVSRSATICIAYVMTHYGMGLEEAFDFVRARRSHISPHLNFMRQLQEYEIQLTTTCSSEQRVTDKVAKVIDHKVTEKQRQRLPSTSVPTPAAADSTTTAS